jgi:DNA repair exonuclease SbcCD ATPase subunit
MRKTIESLREANAGLCRELEEAKVLLASRAFELGEQKARVEAERDALRCAADGLKQCCEEQRAEVERLKAEMLFDEQNETRIVSALEARAERAEAALLSIEEWAREQLGGIVPAHFILNRVRDARAALRDATPREEDHECPSCGDYFDKHEVHFCTKPPKPREEKPHVE